MKTKRCDRARRNRLWAETERVDPLLPLTQAQGYCITITYMQDDIDELNAGVYTSIVFLKTTSYAFIFYGVTTVLAVL